MMRIITGKAKGIRLKTLEGEATRPTTERVKESVFSMLQFDLEGRMVLDLFSGSGQMGLEALSRGAAQAVLVDRAKDAVRVITENAEKCKLIDACRIVQSDSLDYLRRNRGKKADIVFLDPPYASQLYASALVELWECDILKPTSIIVCESEGENPWGEGEIISSRFSVQKTVRYGRVVVTLLCPIFSEKE